uniref:Probable G-protein coupled receptor 34 n=1 Tax=Leptobrachium leishanense TaxID=445787 RepID=A0A8C5Q7Y0_9ANUR
MDAATILPSSMITDLLKLKDNVSFPSAKNNCHIQDGVLSEMLPVMYSIVCAVSLISNSLALLVFWATCQKCSSMVIYMRNLAIADLLLSLCLPFRVAYQNNTGPFLLCKIVGAFFYLNMYASIMFLSLISLDRYLKIVKPLQQFKIHSVSWSTRATQIVWLINVVFIVPFLFEQSSNEPCHDRCFHFKKKGYVGAAINLSAVLVFFILLLLFVYFYGKISVKLHQASMGKTTKPQTKRNSNRAINKSFIVLVIFIVCFVPYHIVRVPYVLAQMEAISSLSWKQTLHIANEIVLCLSTLNSCLDPVIYFFLSDSFRRAVNLTIHGKLKLIVNNQDQSPSNVFNLPTPSRPETQGD